MTKRKKNGEEVAATKSHVPQHFVLIVWEMTMSERSGYQWKGEKCNPYCLVFSWC